MGTSSNQRSPSTPSWRVANTILGRLDAPLERQSQELWRAASVDREGQLSGDLGSGLMAAASRLAESAKSPQEAVRGFNGRVQEERAHGIVVDIGRRALARAVLHGGGAQQFAAELFAETASYYASRDLPSYTAAAGRVGNVGAAVEVKRNLQQLARDAVAAAGAPAGATVREWQRLVGDALTHLSGRR